jgi:hypothetical protein
LENPEAGKVPEKLGKSGIFPENPERLASLSLSDILLLIEDLFLESLSFSIAYI